MAKTSKIKKNEQRIAIAAKYAVRRRELKAIIKSPTSTEEQRAEAYAAIHKMPRDASPTRIKNRCSVSGRARAYLRQFGMSRIGFRDMALQGFIPGVRKASW
ncbi:MAG TPA: 30S ribosomal protein S14 [Gemmatimonadaceae bacterium]|jgi:small subunit ribosomal protein S14|nr:30S ribosomal protein S14 [Gemmatimonadaceae bacterium]